MKRTFSQYIEKFPACLEQLKTSQRQTIKSVSKSLPAAGIYVFYEDNVAQYVGRTGRLRARLREHGLSSSSHFSASFAFILAKKKASADGIDCTRKRAELQKCDLFNPLFKEAKKRVARMEFNWVEITDPIEQTLFEVYAAVELKTLYNAFDPH